MVESRVVVLMMMMLGRVRGFSWCNSRVSRRMRLMSAVKEVTKDEEGQRKHFIREIVENDLASKQVQGVVTRFPPEPNGYLHIGHAKSICLNFGLAKEFSGETFLRFDDTNPEKEDQEYVEAILQDVEWLLEGNDWKEIRYASDYFERMQSLAVWLIKNNLAYVDSQSSEEMRLGRGTLTEPGIESPYRGRSIPENLDLFEKMQTEFSDGEAVLRAKLNMSSPNLNLRDPALYRIKRVHHQRTGDTWSIYPMYDFAHAVSDAIEGITHSLCTLEFENHRPLYDWVIEQYYASEQSLSSSSSSVVKPKQIEFSRLNLQHTITSKRKLASLVNSKLVTGWNDPRMPTIQGLRARGVPPAAIRLFCQRIGISKADSQLEPSILDDCVRTVFDADTDLPRAFGLQEPLELVFDEASDNQEIRISPARVLNFGGKYKHFMERSDFWDTQTQGDLPKGWKRFSDEIGSLVRLRYAYVIECVSVERHETTHEPIRIHCTIDSETFAGKQTAKRSKKKQPGIVQWLRETDAVHVPLVSYNPLFENPEPTENDEINPASLIRYDQALVEKRALDDLSDGKPLQFERTGYYAFKEHEFRRIVPLRNNFAVQISKKETPPPPPQEAEVPVSTKKEDAVPTGKKKDNAPKRRSGGKNAYVDPSRDYRPGTFEFEYVPGTRTYLEPEVIEAAKMELRAGTVIDNEWNVNLGTQTIKIQATDLPVPDAGTDVVVLCNVQDAPRILFTKNKQEQILLIQPPAETQPGTSLLINGCTDSTSPEASPISQFESSINDLILRSGRLYFRFRPLGTENGNRPCLLPSSDAVPDSPLSVYVSA